MTTTFNVNGRIKDYTAAPVGFEDLQTIDITSDSAATITDLKGNPTESQRFPTREQTAPPSPEPGDILHVPKTLLA